jgi:response regulator RpfG family c-di-GMP phosphodiesterase
VNGKELRQQIHENEYIRYKSIPYLFFTISTEQESVIVAYSKSIQGFFIKPSSFDELKSTVKIIVEYWQKGACPNFVK